MQPNIPTIYLQLKFTEIMVRYVVKMIIFVHLLTIEYIFKRGEMYEYNSGNVSTEPNITLTSQRDNDKT
jgi:hypothetical protein